MRNLFLPLLTGSDLIYGPMAVPAMQSLLHTVSVLLRKDETSDGRNSISSSDFSSSSSTSNSGGRGNTGISTRPSFLLAYMRSGSVPLDELFEEARRHGLASEVLEDSTW